MSDSGMLGCQPSISVGQAARVAGRLAVGLAESRPRHRHGLPPAEPIDVSVCIANWNCRAMLRSCLESLHDQSQGVRLETIVVDNASTDGAAEMVAEEFPEVNLVRNPENLGFSRANNQAAAQARGRYLLFLNNDTVVPPDSLRRLFDYAEAHPQVGMIGPRLRDGEGKLQVSYRAQPTVATLLHRTSLLRWTGLFRPAYRWYRRQDFDPVSTREVETLMGAAMFMPREVFRDVGGWDEGYTFGVEDLDLSTRVARTHALVYHPEVEIIHFGRVSSRQHIGFVSSHMAIGFVRYLRATQTPRFALWGYKVVVTLDAPVQVIGKCVQFLWRCVHRRGRKRENTLLALRGLAHFLTRGLIPFWRA